MKSRYLKVAGTAFATASLLVLAGCGGSSNKDENNGGGASIDLSQYLTPTSNRTNEYDEYDIVDGVIEKSGSSSQSWQISGNTATLDSQYEDSDENNYTTITYDASKIYSDTEFAFPRNVTSGSQYTNGEGNNFIVFGPYNSRTFSVGGKSPSRTDNNVIVMITHYKSQNEINVLYLAKGKGFIGANSYWSCSTDISISMSEDYAGKCGGNFSRILTNHK